MAILNSFIIILHIPTIILLIVLRFRQLCYFIIMLYELYNTL